MKMIARFLKWTRPGRGGSVLASLALACVAPLLCSFETPGGGPTGDGSFGSGGGGGDDETVGTLPSVNGPGGLDVRRYLRIQKPSLFVQGPTQTILSCVIAARGDVRALAQPMGHGELRLVLAGDVQVALDRGGFQALGLRVGVVLPQGQQLAWASAAWAGRALPFGRATLDLPVLQLDAQGRLAASPLVAGVATRAGRTAVSVRASSDLLILTQAH